MCPGWWCWQGGMPFLVPLQHGPKDGPKPYSPTPTYATVLEPPNCPMKAKALRLLTAFLLHSSIPVLKTGAESAQNNPFFWSEEMQEPHSELSRLLLVRSFPSPENVTLLLAPLSLSHQTEAAHLHWPNPIHTLPIISHF